MDIVIEALHVLARRGPVLFIIEDLHWADSSSVELLRQLIASPHSASLMALLTARPEFMPTWAAATNVTEVELEALDPAESETFIRKVARGKPLPPDVVWQIRERAAGNPLFLEEITRSVTESGALVEREHAWELVGTLSSDVVPASMEASLMARIDRLGEARSLLQLAATLGREFSYDLLVAVAQSPEKTVRRHLASMLQSGLVFRHGDASPVYTFKHALVRDAAYDSLLRATRQRYHARIAEVLVARFPEIAAEPAGTARTPLVGCGLSRRCRSPLAGRRGERRETQCRERGRGATCGARWPTSSSSPKTQLASDRELSVLTALGPGADGGVRLGGARGRGDLQTRHRAGASA